MNVQAKEQEEKMILQQYRDLLKVVKTKKPEDKRLIRKAFKMAMEAHDGMRRKSGEPYVIHPIQVAIICAGEIGLGTTSIVCALLHDVVEDTDYTLSDIEGLFGKRVAKIIDGLTKISGIFDQSSSSIQAENFRKILLTLSDDVRVILIKLADRLHNMRTLDAMKPEKQLKIASETTFLYAPLAHRLGLYAIKSELEDLALKYTEPEIYNTIIRKLEESETERKRFINNFIFPIKRTLKAEGIEHTIIGRTKSISSIWEKMKKKSIPFEEVFDLFAIRIIIDTPFESEKADCWKVYAKVTDFYKPKQDRLRDWISIPKANGYEALHTTVMSDEGKWVEIQIRTKRMNEIAEKGFAAHWKYKDETDKETGLNEWLNKIRELLQNPDSNALDFLNEFKLNLFSDEIFVFTPKGELRTLPLGASVLDFAYNIHSQIGNHSIGAKVNHKLVPLSYKLKSGDQVEVITSKIQLPKEEWMDYCITARAKSQIKNAVKEERKKLVEKGKNTLKDLLEQLKVQHKNIFEKEFREHLGIKSPVDFYYKLATNEVGLNELKDFQLRTERKTIFSYLRNPFAKSSKSVPIEEEKSLNQLIQDQLKEKPEGLLLGQSVGDIKYNLSDCCNPIPGDEVIGFITADEGIKIHRTNCQSAIQLMSTYGNSIVKTKWAGKESIAFLTGIKIHGVDKMGLINGISKVISEELHINIRSLNINTHDGIFEGNAMLYVLDTKHLESLMKKLRKLAGVQKVYRIN